MLPGSAARKTASATRKDKSSLLTNHYRKEVVAP